MMYKDTLDLNLNPVFNMLCNVTTHSDEEARGRAIRCYIHCTVQRLCRITLEAVGVGPGNKAQARAPQEEHPSQCHNLACFAQSSRSCWRSEVVLSNSAGTN